MNTRIIDYEKNNSLKHISEEHAGKAKIVSLEEIKNGCWLLRKNKCQECSFVFWDIIIPLDQARPALNDNFYTEE